MNTRRVILTAVVWATACTAAWALDAVKTAAKTFSGKVTKVTKLEVTVEKQGVPDGIPVNAITTVLYDDEPTTVKTARTAVLNGRYKEALDMLGKVDLKEVDRVEVKQDVAFYKALCAARLALGGSGDVRKAGGQMYNFRKNNPDSYHYLDACEVLGDLFVAVKEYAQAQAAYSEIGKAPWPDYKMRSGVAEGRALLAQGKTAEAVEKFNSVLGGEFTDTQGELAEFQRMAAKLGLARCLAKEKKYDEAIKQVTDIIAKADPEEVELHARAYNTLGTALKAAGRTKEALLAFLHVDVLYFAVPDAHAEALANLAELWNAAHKPERASAAQRTLQERYRNSPWASQ